MRTGTALVEKRAIASPRVLDVLPFLHSTREGTDEGWDTRRTCQHTARTNNKLDITRAHCLSNASLTEHRQRHERTSHSEHEKWSTIDRRRQCNDFSRELICFSLYRARRASSDRWKKYRERPGTDPRWRVQINVHDW